MNHSLKIAYSYFNFLQKCRNSGTITLISPGWCKSTMLIFHGSVETPVQISFLWCFDSAYSWVKFGKMAYFNPGGCVIFCKSESCLWKVSMSSKWNRHKHLFKVSSSYGQHAFTMMTSTSISLMHQGWITENKTYKLYQL